MTLEELKKMQETLDNDFEALKGKKKEQDDAINEKFEIAVQDMQVAIEKLQSSGVAVINMTREYDGLYYKGVTYRYILKLYNDGQFKLLLNFNCELLVAPDTYEKMGANFNVKSKAIIVEYLERIITDMKELYYDSAKAVLDEKQDRNNRLTKELV